MLIPYRHRKSYNFVQSMNFLPFRRYEFWMFLPFSLRKWLFHLHSSPNYCNICGAQPKLWFTRGRQHPIIEKLNIIGAGYRQVDCPVCGSSDRDRLVFQYIQQQIQQWKLDWAMNDGAQSAIRILHIAPEKGLQHAIHTLFQQHFAGIQVEYVLADKFTKGYYYRKRGMVYLDLDKPFELVEWTSDGPAGTVSNFPSPNKKFHLILANHVLEHVNDLAYSINQLQNQMAVNAQFLVTLPIAENLNRSIEIKTLEPNFTALPAKKQHQLAIQFLGQWDHKRLLGQDWHNCFPHWQSYSDKNPSMLLNPEEKVLIFNNKNNP